MFKTSVSPLSIAFPNLANMELLLCSAIYNTKKVKREAMPDVCVLQLLEPFKEKVNEPFEIVSNSYSVVSNSFGLSRQHYDCIIF